MRSPKPSKAPFSSMNLNPADSNETVLKRDLLRMKSVLEPAPSWGNRTRVHSPQAVLKHWILDGRYSRCNDGEQRGVI